MSNSINSSIFFLLALFILGGCSTTVNSKIWDTSSLQTSGLSEPDRPYFPELDDKDYLEHRPNTVMGIAFSGGGTRSAPASIGQLVGLKRTGLMEKTDYFSVISGGAWAVVPYIYLPFDKDETIFLGGDYIPPKDLQNCHIFTSILRECLRNYEPHPRETEFEKFDRICIDPDTERIPTFMPLNESIYCNGKVLRKMIWATMNGLKDEIFADVLSKIFLDPYDLGPTRILGRPIKSKFFAWDKCPIHDNCNHDFNLVVRDRPFLVASSTLMIDDTNKQRFYPLEMTPLYTGIRKQHQFGYFEDKRDGWKRKNVPNWIKDPKKGFVGGMYIESFGYDSKRPKELVNSKPDGNPGRVKLVISKEIEKFSLENMIAATGAAPQETMRKAPIPFNLIGNNIGFPEHYYWTIHGEFNGREEKPLGDGGHMDNYGLMPLLARHVKNILVFVNEFTPYQYDQISGKRTIDDNVVSYFDMSNKYMTYRKIFEHYPHNVVFEKKMLDKMFENFDIHNDNGSPLLSCHKNVTILSNERYGIEGSKTENNTFYRPNICFLYLGFPQKWLNEIQNSKLSKKVKNDILYRSGPYTRFPHYRTFFENGLIEEGHFQGAIIKLSFEKTKLLSNLTAWSVIMSEEEIRENFELN